MVRAFTYGAMGHRMNGPIELFLVPASALRLVNKGCGMCYPVCVIMHIKPLAANRKELPMWWQRVSSLAILVVLDHMSDAI